MEKSARIAVLGAGLTGASVALELAWFGVEVVLIEQDPQPVNRASLRNEGKIHLGLIYANEGSLETAKLQLQGALSFRSSLARWIGDEASRIPCSTPFVYLVSRTSLCNADFLESHYAEVQQLYRTYIERESVLDYLGRRPAWLYRRQSSVPGRFRRSDFLASFETQERAIDTQVLAEYLRAAIRENPLIHTLTGLRVREVTNRGDRIRVEASSVESVWRRDFDQVVNALWDGRVQIDLGYGLRAEPGWLYRLKYRVIVKLPERLADAPSATIVLGRYGDVVIRPDGTAYLSWYPSGMKGWSDEREPPGEWAAVCRGGPVTAEALAVAEETLTRIDAWYPGVGESQVLLADAGVICAYGNSDVDDPSSQLHGRSHVGVRSDRGYHSVDPGKLTTAPYFARLAAQAVMQH